jgi:hypothetical protein
MTADSSKYPVFFLPKMTGILVIGQWPNKSPEPTVVGALVLFATDLFFFINFSPRWLSFLR